MRLTHLLPLTLGLLLTLPAWAARELSWDDLVPAGTGHLYGMPPAQHDGLTSEGQASSNPLVQSMTNAPTVAELDGENLNHPLDEIGSLGHPERAAVRECRGYLDAAGVHENHKIGIRGQRG